MKNTLTPLLLSLLTACGGGGSSSPTLVEAIVGYFYAGNEISLTSQFAVSSMTTNTVADMNGDGKDDLIVHYWTGIYWKQQVGNLPCPNEVKIYTYQSNGSFKDETSSLVVGSTDLGGCSAKSKVYDINGDGKLDIIYAISQEDGRLQNNNNTAMNGQLAALVSVGNKYKVTKFGTSAWYASVGAGTYNGQVFVTGYGFNSTTPEAYTFDLNGDATLAQIPLPSFLSANTFEFYNNTMIETGDQMLNIQSYKIENNQWVSAGNLPVPYTKVADIQFYSYTSEGPFNAEVLDVGNGMYTLTKNGNAITDSCKLKLKPTENPVTVMKMELPIIKNYQLGITSVVRLDNSNSIMMGNKLVGANIVNGQLTNVNLNIDNEQIFTNAWSIQCEDVNGDGYQDIIVNSDTLPHVYLNDKNNGFKYLGKGLFPTINESLGNNVTSILHDFDKDGISDLVIFPTGVNVSKFKYLYYKGHKLLN